MHKESSALLFASAKPSSMDREETLPSRFLRLLERLDVQKSVKNRVVAVKMHVGGGVGYSTVHPLFVRLLVEHLKRGSPSRIFITDASVEGADMRGYCRQTVGAPLLPAIGKDGRDVSRRYLRWDKIKSVEIGNPVLNADVLINLSHVKAHGDCGFGGACKNLAMGCVPPGTRMKMHSLEGSLTWNRKKCIRCDRCLRECPTKANRFDEDGEYRIFWHNCRMCQHCVLACPESAISIMRPEFDLMQEGLARVAQAVLNNFGSGSVFHINFLTFITIFCDCWGLTTPALVPDIGIIAGRDIVAVDQASLDAVKTSDLIPGSLTPPYRLGKGRHLFEKIHGKDPYAQVRSMEQLGMGSTKYALTEIK